MVIFMAENVSKVVADVFIREKIMQALWYLWYNVMPDMCDYINCALKNIYKRCSMYEFNTLVSNKNGRVKNLIK